MSGQIVGFTQANVLEVDANTLAAHATLRPEDYGALGIYSIAGASGIMAAGFTAFSTAFSFRWGVAAAKYALVHRVRISMAIDTVAMPAGVCGFDMFVARGWSAADTGGTGLTPTTNNGKLRTSMATSAVSDIRISSTTNLTAGTRTLDKLAIGILVAGTGEATIGKQLIPPTLIFDQRPGDMPLILAGNEGFVLNPYVGATGTWKFAVQVDWSEVNDISSYL